MQTASYSAFGVNAFAARFPSALAALLAVLLVYELGRHMFGKDVGLLAGVILATSVLFGAAAHFANPDAILLAFSMLYCALFWWDYQRNGRLWLYLGGVAAGLAVLAKGPVGLALPVAVVGLFLLWERKANRFFTWHFIGGGLLFALTAAPWYVWVALETKGAWLRGFWFKHNQGRFLATMEGHSGIPGYYFLILLLGVAPWSVFFAGLIWDGVRQYRKRNTQPEEEGEKGRRGEGENSAIRFLLCWVAVWFCFFSIGRTKLPNYILPLYPALAVLLARFLDRWRRGLVEPPRWIAVSPFIGLAFLGVLMGVALLIAGGAITIPGVTIRPFVGLEKWAWLCAIPLTTAGVCWHLLRRGRRDRVIHAFAASAILGVGTILAFLPAAINPYKAPHGLAQALPADHQEREVRVGVYGWFQPSLVFYCRREVHVFHSEPLAVEFLNSPLPVYLAVPESHWARLRERLGNKVQVLHRQFDFDKQREIILVTNQAEGVVSRE
jgi:4-amino-4-deoxy-L-arabinose transferase-like glycosyltransferase